MNARNILVSFVLGSVTTAGVWAKLPPLSPEKQAAAAEAKAKAAYMAKRDAYDACRAMDRSAAIYLATAHSEGKSVKPIETPPCEEPGPYGSSQAAQPARRGGKS